MKQSGKRLKMLRKAKKLKQTDMAALLNATPHHYQNMEYEKINVPDLTFIKLADYFAVPIDHLVARYEASDQQ